MKIKRFISKLLIVMMLINGMSSGFVFADTTEKAARYMVYYSEETSKTSQQNKMLERVQTNQEGIVINDNISVVVDTRSDIIASFSDKTLHRIEEDRVVKISTDDNGQTTTPSAITLLPQTLADFSGTTGAGIKIALLDSGVDTAKTGIDLAGGVSFVAGSDYETDENGHGTALAGLIKGYTASDGGSFIGAAQQAELYSVKILDENGNGYYSDVIRGLDWARQNRIDVVIMAFGADSYSAILHESVQKAYLQDILLVAAGGNSDEPVQYPAAYSEVMAVGSSHQAGTAIDILYQYEDKEKIEVYTAGRLLESVDQTNQTTFKTGASVSATLVAAIASRLWSTDKTLNANEIRGLISYSAFNYQSYPILNIKQANAYLASGTIPTEQDYLSQIQAGGNENAQVSGLAEFEDFATEVMTWQDVVLKVKFSHNHNTVDATLINSDTGQAVQQVTLTGISGGHDGENYTGSAYTFNFGKAPRGAYYVHFDPSREEIVDPNLNIEFDSDRFEVLGSDVTIEDLQIVGTPDPVVAIESLKVKAIVRNVNELDFSTDYPEDLLVTLHLITDNGNTPIDEATIVLDDSNQVDSAEITAAQLASGQVEQAFSWSPTEKQDIANYKLIAWVHTEQTYDDNYSITNNPNDNRQDNNTTALKGQFTVTFRLPGNQKWQVYIADPVEASSGNYNTSVTDLTVAGYAPISFNRYYNAQDYKAIGYGLHWRHSYDMYYEKLDDYVKVYFDDGRVEFFPAENGVYQYNKSKYQAAYFNALGQWVLADKNHRVYTFNSEAAFSHIASIEERGVKTDFEYSTYYNTNSEQEEVKLTKISALSGAISINYTDDYQYITSISDSAGRTVHYSYDGRYLKTVTNVAGQSYGYHYNDRGLLTQVIDPSGNNQLTNDYDAALRVTTQINEDGTTTTFQYDDDKTVFTRRDGQVETYYKDDLGRITKREYPDGSARYVFDDDDNLIRYFDKNGNETNYNYDANGNRIAEVNALGESTSYSYNADGDITSLTTADGSVTSFSYDDKGNITSITDALNQTQQIHYDSNYQVQTMTRKDGTTVSYSYDGRGNLISESVAGELVKSYRYDAVNRLTEVINPKGDTVKSTYLPNGKVSHVEYADGSTISYHYDNEARLVSETDARGGTTTYAYNDMGSLTKLTTADGALTQYSYDMMQRLVETTYADGATVELSYDNAGRVIEKRDELGGITQYSYDNNGNVIEKINPKGQRESYSYDGLNRLISVTDNLGGTTSYSYRYDGQLESESDVLGNVTGYSYDVLGRLIKKTFADGTAVSFSYSPLDEIISTTDQLGRTTYYTYDEQSRLLQVTYADGSVLTNVYDSNGNRVKQIDALGNETLYHYDIKNRLVEMIDPLSGSTSYTYDANDNVISTTNPLGATTSFSYDAMNRNIAIVDAEGNQIKLDYDSLGRLVKQTAQDDSVKTFEYDLAGRLIKQTDEIGAVTGYRYDMIGNITEIVDPLGAVLKQDYDGLNRLTSISDPLGGVTTLSYDGLGNLLTETDALGHTTSYSYDSQSRLSSVQDAATGLQQYSYDAVGNLIHYQDALGRQTGYSYDARNRLTTLTAADGTTRQQSYDQNGNIISTTDGLGNAITYDYDALNRLVKVTSAERNSRSFSYTATSQLAIETDGAGNQTQYSYDVLERLIEKRDALGAPTTYQYDTRGNLISTTQMKGITQAVYQTLPEQAGYQPDEMTALVTHYQYNARGELIKETGALGGSINYSYDLAGNLVEKIDQDGFITRYQYDANKQLIEKQISGGIVADKQDSIVKYQRDLLGRVTERSDDLYRADGMPAKVYRYSYDVLGRLTSESDFEGKTTSLAYDAVGNNTEMVYPDGSTVSYSYDALNRLLTTSDKDGTNRYQYDAAGNRLRLDFASGAYETYTYDKDGRTLSQVTVDYCQDKMTAHDYSYDANNNITVDVFEDYDSLYGSETSVKSYQYDALGQLVTEKLERECYYNSGTIKHYYYDTVGNRIQQSASALPSYYHMWYDIEPTEYVTHYTYNEQNQLTEQYGACETLGYHYSDAFSFNYDQRGNLTAMISDGDYVSQYYYDGINKLRYSTDKQDYRSRYSYDGINRRIKKESETSLDMSASSPVWGCYIIDALEQQVAAGIGSLYATTTQNFVYHPLSKYDHILMTYGRNMATQKFVYGEADKASLIKIDRYDQMGDRWDEQSDDTYYDCYYDYANSYLAKETFQDDYCPTTRYVIKDIRGSVEQLVSRWGYKAESYQYTAFGEERYQMSIDDIHGFASYVRDRETATNYVNARQYLPEIGRFMAEDKLLVDGLNRYLYVGNNPVNWVDPTGLLINKSYDFYLKSIENSTIIEYKTKLIELSYLPMSVRIDNIMNNLTRAAVKKFQQDYYVSQITGNFDRPTQIAIDKALYWKGYEKYLAVQYPDENRNYLSGCQNSEVGDFSVSSLDKAILLTMSFEGRGYVNVTGNFDGQGISLGAFQWNIGQGTLQPMLEDFIKENPVLAKEIFNDDYEAIANMLNLSKNEQLLWAQSINVDNKILPKWEEYFIKLCETSEFKIIQKNAMKEWINQAYKIVNDYGLKSEKGLALALDIAVQNWDVKKSSRNMIKNKIEMGISEEEILRILAYEVAAKANPIYYDDVLRRKLTIANGEGEVHGKYYNLEKDYDITSRNFY